jgi:pilus assembly protein CpaB
MPLRLVVSILMLLTALALGMIAYQLAVPVKPVLMTAAPQGPIAPLEVGYFVAARPLPAGTFVRDEDFALKSVLPARLPTNAITDLPENRANLRGALIRRYMDAGTMITQEDLLRSKDRGFLAAVLEPGTRAVSVAVDAVSGVSGLIWPGDRVDLILTQEMDHAVAPLSRRVLSETILTNVRVIAVDQDIVRGTPVDGLTTGHVARTVALQLATDEAERVTVAQQLGHLALAVRAIGSPLPSLTMQPTLFSGDVSPALSKTDEPAGARIQVIEGSDRREVKFQ